LKLGRSSPVGIDGLAGPVGRLHLLLAAGALALVTLVAYLPALRSGFIWDDDATLTQNALMKAPDGLYRYWCTTEPADYWPVTSTTLWLEWRLWGLNALGYHATNVALHACSAFLLWMILRRLRVPGSYLAAVIFAVHPVNVESVAWIAERKNVLSMLFFLVSVLSFLRSGLWSGGGPGRNAPTWGDRWYWLSLLAFTLGMLSKGSIAMLPVVLVGLLAFKGARGLRNFLPTVPFFVISGAFVIVDVWFQGHHLTEVIRRAGFLERLFGAGAVVWFYLLKALMPIGLVFAYPQWHLRPDEMISWVPLVLAAALTGFLMRSRGRWAQPAFFAWGYFCVSLVPVMGFSDVYFMRYSPVADHYQYVAIIGVIAYVCAAWATWRAWEAQKGLAPVAQGAAAAVIMLLVYLTSRQCEIYRDSETLFRSILKANPGSTLASGNLGELLLREERYGEALVQLRAASAKDPGLPEVHADLGATLQALGRVDEARSEYEAALRISPDFAGAHYMLGLSLLGSGRPAEALGHFQETIKLHEAGAKSGRERTGIGWTPESMVEDARMNLGIALMETGEREAAVQTFQAILVPDPGNARVRNYLGLAFASEGRMPEAVEEYHLALKIMPGYPEAGLNLGLALLRMNRLDEAAAEYRLVLQSDPQLKAAHLNLGNALFRMGRLDDAVAEYHEALRLDPEYPAARKNLAEALAAQGHAGESGDDPKGGVAPSR
jgi:protein O-mannosyl-transferase